MTEQQVTVEPVGPTTAEIPPPPAKDRRVLRAVARWAAAALVFGALGAGTAYGITTQERSDLPGLATEPDGRWDYPTLTLPPLPSGSPRPFEERNITESHHADLRALVLPAPKRAKQDPSLVGKDGWLPTATYLAQYETEDREAVAGALAERGLRHIAARGWTTPDGTRTRIFLLRFNGAAAADDFLTDGPGTSITPIRRLLDAGESELDETFPAAANMDNINWYAYTEQEPYGNEHVRQAYIQAGDTIALVVLAKDAKKGAVADVPFQQTVVLQSQLLS
ncbi:hypothetical protein [Streptomyces sp. NPDC000410]|uniref:hypothetical protein n=1 Tax=Streptomyces sp. NPDC000410 TaxID=3154254 RepID=UPI00333449A1